VCSRAWCTPSRSATLLLGAPPPQLVGASDRSGANALNATPGIRCSCWQTLQDGTPSTGQSFEGYPAPPPRYAWVGEATTWQTPDRSGRAPRSSCGSLCPAGLRTGRRRDRRRPRARRARARGARPRGGRARSATSSAPTSSPSMGQEKPGCRTARRFRRLQVSRELLRNAGGHVTCFTVYPPPREEIEAEVSRSSGSAIWDSSRGPTRIRRGRARVGPRRRWMTEPPRPAGAGRFVSVATVPCATCRQVSTRCAPRASRSSAIGSRILLQRGVPRPLRPERGPDGRCRYRRRPMQPYDGRSAGRPGTARRAAHRAAARRGGR